MFALATIVLSLALSVASIAVPRATPPAGWNTPLLENYDTYHTRYMALDCNNKHNTAFFDQCCHPLLATQSLASRPAQCTPDSDNDDDLPFCDELGDDDESSTVVVHPSTSKAPVVVHTTAVAHTTAVTHTTTPAAVHVTSSAKPAATASPNSASSSSVNSGGFATFFFQNGVAGACGTVHKDTDMIAAIDGDRYGNLGARSSLCGKQVKLTNTKNNKSVVVTIADACPTCVNSNSIDLSQGAFEKIATLDEGMVPITWSFL